MTTTEEAERNAQDAVTNQRPISAAAGRNLLKIVENDFKQVKAEIEVFRADEIARVEAKIRGDLDAEKIEEIKKEATKFRKKINKQIVEFKEQYPDLDIRFFSLSHTNLDIEIRDTVLAARINEATKKINADTHQARQIAEREFRKIERLVLMATVTSQAENILAGIPTVHDLMAKAYEARQTPKSLGGSE